MRFMIIVKATEESEAGKMPSTELLTKMGEYNEQLVKAGVLLAGDGLHPSAKGARVYFDADGRTRVVDGPFTETKELIAGYWILQLSSKEEAIEWVKRVPSEPGQQGEIEIRQLFDMEDFGDELTPALREQDARLRAQTEQRQGA